MALIWILSLPIISNVPIDSREDMNFDEILFISANRQHFQLMFEFVPMAISSALVMKHCIRNNLWKSLLSREIFAIRYLSLGLLPYSTRVLLFFPWKIRLVSVTTRSCKLRIVNFSSIYESTLQTVRSLWSPKLKLTLCGTSYRLLFQNFFALSESTLCRKVVGNIETRIKNPKLW